jgi:hypothetical protein
MIAMKMRLLTLHNWFVYDVLGRKKHICVRSGEPPSPFWGTFSVYEGRSLVAIGIITPRNVVVADGVITTRCEFWPREAVGPDFTFRIELPALNYWVERVVRNVSLQIGDCLVMNNTVTIVAFDPDPRDRALTSGLLHPAETSF